VGGQVALVEPAEQILDRVQNRRGVGLDRYSIGSVKVSNHSDVVIDTTDADDAW
jgi:hypothetical protein